MSHDPVFNVDYHELGRLASVNRPDLSIKIADRLKDKEPEPKLWVPTTSSFLKIRDMLDRSADVSIIPGTIENTTNPLLSILVDTRKHGDPKCKIGKANRDLRVRCNVDGYGVARRFDWNEKSRNATSEKCNGLGVRDEIEYEMPMNMAIEDGYRFFQQESIGNNSGAIAEQIDLGELYPKSAYMTGRTTYELAQRVSLHENGRTYDFMIVYEACEDITLSLDGALTQTSPGEILEFEIEAKRIIGKIPPRLWSSDEALKDVLTKNLILMRDAAQLAEPKSIVMDSSKAETSISHLSQFYGDGIDLSGIPLSETFQNPHYKGEGREFSPEEFSILAARTIQETLNADQSVWGSEMPPLLNAAGISGYLSGLRATYQIKSAEQEFLISPKEIKAMGLKARMHSVMKSIQRTFEPARLRA